MIYSYGARSAASEAVMRRVRCNGSESYGLILVIAKASLDIEIQWGLEYQTRLDFKWSGVVHMMYWFHIRMFRTIAKAVVMTIPTQNHMKSDFQNILILNVFRIEVFDI